MGKKLKGFLLSVLISSLPYVIVIALLGGGIFAVVSVFTETEKVIGSHATVEELLEAVQNGETITDEMMEGWMLDRGSMIHLLQEITEYNNREADSKSFKIEVEKYWYEPVATPTPIVTPVPVTTPEITGNPNPSPAPTQTPEEGTETEEQSPTPTPEPKYEYCSETYYSEITIGENQDIIKKYPLDWQLAYLLCVYDQIDYGHVNSSTATSTVNYTKITEIVNALKPRYEYEFNPVTNWHFGTPKLSISEVQAHPHNVIQYSYTTLETNVKDGLYHIYYCTPKFVLKKVTLPWKEDTYTMMADGTYQVVTEYKADVILGIYNRYVGQRDMELFLESVDLLPGGIRIGDEIRKALKESGYEDEIQRTE